MESNNVKLRREMLQVLYPETNTLGDIRLLKPETLAELLEAPVEEIVENLRYFQEKNWVTIEPGGIKLTDQAVWAIRQHERTYCPYI